MHTRPMALSHAITFAGVLTMASFASRPCAAQDVFPGSSGSGRISSDEKEVEVRTDSGKGQSQVTAKQRISYTLDVRWSLVDAGLSASPPLTLSPREDNICAVANASHAECGVRCGIHYGSEAGQARGTSRDLDANMAQAHRDSTAQNGEVGSADLGFDSATTDIRQRVRKWAEETVRVSGGSSQKACSFTTHKWRFRRYLLRINWTWKRTTSTLSSATGGRWSAPVSEAVNVTTPTQADILEAERLDPRSHETEDKVVCACAKKKDDGGGRGDPPKTPTNTTGTGKPVRTPTYSGLGVNPLPAGATPKIPAPDAPKKDGGSVRTIDVMPELKTGTINPLFQKMIVEVIPPLAADPAPRVPPASARLGAWLDLIAAWIVPRALAASPEQEGNDLAVSLVATGSSTGQVFSLRALNTGEKAVNVSGPDGLVLEALRDPAKAAAQRLQSEIRSQPVSGYCLEFGKLPPAAGTLYRIGEPASQRQFGPLVHILQASRKLAAEGRLHPDSDAAGYGDAIKQWALWSRLETWSAGDFERHFVERTRKNVEASRQPWSKALEDRVRRLAPNRWRDINSVWAEADAAAARVPGR